MISRLISCKLKKVFFLKLFVVLSLFFFSSPSPFCGSGEAAGAAAPKKSHAPDAAAELSALKHIDENCDLFIKINPAAFLKELSVSKQINSFISASGLKNINSLSQAVLLISYGRHPKGNMNFAAVIKIADFDYDKFLDKLKSADENFKTGDYEGKTVFRYFNLAGFYYSGRIYLSSVSGLKKILGAVAGKSDAKPLSENKEFALKCAEITASNHGAQAVAVMGKAFLGAYVNSADENDFVYKNLLKNAAGISFVIDGARMKISVECENGASAAALCKAAAAQIESSLKEAAEALSEVDVIEVESKSQKMTRAALKEIVYSRKLLNFIIDINKKAKPAVKANAVEININSSADIVKAVDELICAHIYSWGLVAQLFLSSEAGCLRNIKILETAALLYLAKFPEKKNLITVEDIYETELINDLPKCPSGADYKISVDGRGKITAGCPVHK